MSQDSVPFDWSRLAVDSASYAFSTQPRVVGYWVLYPSAPAHVKFAMYHKPTAEQIANTEQLLGWGWKDAE